MAKVSIITTEYMPIVGSGMTVDVLFRRVPDLERIAIAERAQSETTKTVTREIKSPDPKTRAKIVEREVYAYPDRGRMADALDMALQACVRGWRGVMYADETGVEKELPFTMDNLKSVCANYPDWAEDLYREVQSRTGMHIVRLNTNELVDDKDQIQEGTPNPQSGS